MAPSTKLEARLASLEPDIKQICAVAGTPGISLGVIHRGGVIHRANYGFADVEAQTPTTSKTVYPIGTMAKALTASAVGILVAEGKLQWTTPIRDILPLIETQSPLVTQNLNVVDLLSHRSGLARSNMWWQGAEGALLLAKSDLLAFYSKLEPTGNFRADWAYSNWGYAIVGEVIEKLSGMTYGSYVTEKLLRPLGMDSTAFDKTPSTDLNLAKSYAAMDNASPHPMPFPPVHDGTIMAPAMGGRSSLDDLLIYASALLQAFRSEAGIEKGDNDTKPPVIRNALKQLSGHIFTTHTLLEKSYAFGFYRTQLPNTVLGMGWNSIYVREMPTLVPAGHAGPLLAHGGSLPGYHVAVALLPDLNSGVVVCTNSIALGDVSGWVSLAVLEALIDAPRPSDFVRLATEAARSNAGNVVRLRTMLDNQRKSTKLPRSLDQYVGRYKHPTHDWFLDVEMDKEGRLQVLFKGLKSQCWNLNYYEDDTFLWLADREEQAKRGRMTTYPLVANHFKLIFQTSEAGQINRVCWPHEAGLSWQEQCFLKES